MGTKSDQEFIDESLKKSFVGFFYCPACKKQTPIAHDCLGEFIDNQDNIPDCCGRKMFLFPDKNAPGSQPGTKEFDLHVASVILAKTKREIAHAQQGCQACLRNIYEFLCESIETTPYPSFIIELCDCAVAIMEKKIDETMKNNETPNDEEAPECS